jgi:hypothetical protein
MEEVEEEATSSEGYEHHPTMVALHQHEGNFMHYFPLLLVPVLCSLTFSAGIPTIIYTVFLAASMVLGGLEYFREKAEMLVLLPVIVAVIFLGHSLTLPQKFIVGNYTLSGINKF